MNELMTIAAAAELIRRGVPLSVAGPQAALDALPAGAWIGGTTPYFMAAGGGRIVTDDQVFVTDLARFGQIRFAYHTAEQLADISALASDNGVSLAIIPAGSEAHRRFAHDAATYPDAFLKPTVGWIAGVHLDDLGRVKPRVYDGRSATSHDDGAVVAYLDLPADRLAEISIVNIFEPDDGDTLQFLDTSFEVRDCLVNGERVNLAAYLVQRGAAHGRLPLVGDFAGARINVSLQNVDAAAGTVALYAPVFPGVTYRLARPVADYAGEFRQQMAQTHHDDAAFSCNCILNFVFGELEGKAIGGVQGPITFGEIAYQLLNQTLVELRVQ